jgi:hypothetical protein
MKNIISILSLILSFQISAENWISKEMLNSNQAFQLKSDCLKKYSDCFDIGDLPHSVYSLKDIEVDDENSPKYSKTNPESCTDDCIEKLSNKVCENDEYPIRTESEVYCSKLIGFNKKTVQKIELDQAKKSDYDSAQLLKAENELKEKEIQDSIKQIENGKRVIAIMSMINRKKNLTTEQVAQFSQAYSSVKGLLETGSLLTAKALIQSITPDGILTTQEDKDTLVNEINKLLE